MGRPSRLAPTRDERRARRAVKRGVTSSSDVAPVRPKPKTPEQDRLDLLTARVDALEALIEQLHPEI